MKKLLQNGKKGFTLTELIVVIVIIAILIAALTPAILGVIDRANRAADEADARSIMMAASMAAIPLISSNSTTLPTHTQIRAELTPNDFRAGFTVTVFFERGVAVGVRVTAGRRSRGDNDTHPILIGRETTAVTGQLTGPVAGFPPRV
ncbi:MAG: prepilin-type N-terminal cleavage/methylation domain-containing protein [Defluviitaleaceae bacterium]|nr:prepilin-type N-terminal cleavage/methylation domain-containing protein [Defluviitaleaceae bacterium]